MESESTGTQVDRWPMVSIVATSAGFVSLSISITLLVVTNVPFGRSSIASRRSRDS